MDSLQDVVVLKPWGYEYLCYRNELLAIWLLHIKRGQRTSLHCHPNKHTGFVVLDGVVIVRFLRGEHRLAGLDKLHIFRARFHSTEALSESGAYILEIETPEDKHDLVRLEDAYGRSGLAYEGTQHHVPKPTDAFWIPEPNFQSSIHLALHGCTIRHIAINQSSDLLGFAATEILVVLRGGLRENAGAQILSPGDVVDGASLGRLAVAFSVVPNTSVLALVRANNEYTYDL